MLCGTTTAPTVMPTNGSVSRPPSISGGQANYRTYRRQCLLQAIENCSCRSIEGKGEVDRSSEEHLDEMVTTPATILSRSAPLPRKKMLLSRRTPIPLLRSSPLQHRIGCPSLLPAY